MKHLFISIFTFALMASILPSCQMKEDDLFELDPATRQDNWMSEYRRVFNNNDYGWALYVDAPTYGRHPKVNTFGVKFDQTTCTFFKSVAMGWIPAAGDAEEITSYYSFKADNGIVLSFDTYNVFLHYAADQSQYFSQDLQSDFEFCLDRYSENEDTIFGRGKTKQLPFMMIKMPCTAQEYQDACDDIHSNYAPYNCAFVMDNDTLTARFYSGYHNFAIYVPNEETGEEEEQLYSYGTLMNGIYMMENITYHGMTIKEFELNEAKDGFTDKITGARIVPKPYVNYFLKDSDYDDFFFGYSSQSANNQVQWDKAREALDNCGFYPSTKLVYVCVQPNGDGTASLLFNKWYGSGEIYYDLELKKVSDTEIAIRYTGNERTGLGFSPYDAGLKYIVDNFAKTDKWTTYKITPTSGSAISPAEFKFESEEDPNNWFYFPNYFRYYHQSIWD